MIGRALETVGVLLTGVVLGASGYWLYNGQAQKADKTLEANKTLQDLVENVLKSQEKIEKENKAIAPGLALANKSLNEIRGKVDEFKDLDSCVASDELFRMLSNQIDAYNQNRTVPGSVPES